MRDFKVSPATLCPPPPGSEISFPSFGSEKKMDCKFTDLQQRMQTDPPAGVSASPIADNVMTWLVAIPTVPVESLC